MALITRPNSYTAGTVAVAGQVNNDFNTIYNDYNGNITNANISASAAIVDTKLNQISTTGKVSTTALTIASQATGDLLYAGSATTWSRLAVGSATQLLHGGTTPAYSALAIADLPNGTVLQMVSTTTGAVATNTTAFTYDDNVPQNTEGAQVMSLAITPNLTTSKLIIQVVVVQADSGQTRCGVGLFQDSTASALAANAQIGAAVNSINVVSLNWSMTSGTVSATTFKVRAGAESGTYTFNGQGGTRRYGGALASSIVIWEVKA